MKRHFAIALCALAATGAARADDAAECTDARLRPQVIRALQDAFRSLGGTIDIKSIKIGSVSDPHSKYAPWLDAVVTVTTPDYGSDETSTGEFVASFEVDLKACVPAMKGAALLE